MWVSCSSCGQLWSGQVRQDIISKRRKRSSVSYGKRFVGNKGAECYRHFENNIGYATVTWCQRSSDSADSALCSLPVLVPASCSSKLRIVKSH